LTNHLTFFIISSIREEGMMEWSWPYIAYTREQANAKREEYKRAGYKVKVSISHRPVKRGKKPIIYKVYKWLKEKE